MANEQLVVAIFEGEAQADVAVQRIQQWDKVSQEVRLGAIGVLVKDENGAIKTHAVGKRNTKTGIAAGALSGILSGGLTVLGGAIGGGVKLSAEDKTRIVSELDKGRAAVCIAANAEEAALVSAKLADLGGVPETYAVSDEAPAEAEPPNAAFPRIRFGNKTLETVLKTDELYGHDPLWLGPHGRDYGAMLPNPKPWQHANLYPDPNASYWLAFLEMAAGSRLTLRGLFPHGRYFQFALYRPDPLGSFTGTGEAFVDYRITPDSGSVNPFVPGTNRRAENRSYTIHILNEEPPTDRAQRTPNTLYAGAGGQIQIVYRVYLPDVGYLGDAGAGLPTYTATLADGTALSPEDVVERFNNPPLQGIESGMTVEQWRAICNAPDNDRELKPETTPARTPPVLERYFNNKWNLFGVFKSPEDRRAKFPSDVLTGFGGDPITLFMMSFVSRKFGSVLVIRGKMPMFPNTFAGEDGQGLGIMTDWESRYWSVIMSEAPPSGMGADALADMQVPLDADRNYTIVVCRPEDRPENATEANGVAWLDWGIRGEGLADDLNRTDFGLVLFRFMYNNPNWTHNPGTIVAPGTEEAIMGPYMPRLSYTTKPAFEAGEG